MQVLYKDENENLAVMEVLKAAYIPEAKVLELCGSEEDITVEIGKKDAVRAVKELYQTGKADLSAYSVTEMDFDDDEDFFDDEDEDDEDDDFIDRMIDMDFGPDGKNGVFFRSDK